MLFNTFISNMYEFNLINISIAKKAKKNKRKFYININELIKLFNYHVTHNVYIVSFYQPYISLY